jgi:hypothetical protein
MKRLLAISLGLCLLTACTSIEMLKVSVSRGEGSKRLYDDPFNKVYSATLSTVRKQKLEILESNESEGRVILSHGLSLMSWGEGIVVFVTRVSDGATEVEVVVKPVTGPWGFPPHWDYLLFIGIDEELRKN